MVQTSLSATPLWRVGQGEAGRGEVRQGGAGCAREGKGGAL